MRKSLQTIIFTIATGFLAVGCATTSPDKAKDETLLFTFFREPNGQDGLQLATSTNGLNWTEIKAPNGTGFIKPAVGGKLMRDPSLALGPDGTFHMVWTTSWGRPPVFGYASSKDLIHWSEQQAISVMEDDPTAENVWAPELFYDDKKAQWLIFWATTIPGKFPETKDFGGHNHRIYCVTTKDFKRFSKTKLFYDGGFNVIDATILPAKGKYYLIMKDETKNPVKKDLHLAVSDNAEGPYSKAGPAISGDWVEGPSGIQIGSEYYIYFDHYMDPKYYGGIESTDMEHWEDISASTSFPSGFRHGTVLWVPRKIVNDLEANGINTMTK
jgi:beta-xylosidase